MRFSLITGFLLSGQLQQYASGGKYSDTLQCIRIHEQVPRISIRGKNLVRVDERDLGRAHREQAADINIYSRLHQLTLD